MATEHVVTFGGYKSNLTNEQLDVLVAQTSFSRSDINTIFKRFKKLDTDKSGEISLSEFLEFKDLEVNPLVSRLAQVIDANKNGQVDFQEFLTSLSVFYSGEETNEKQLFAFKIYDVDNDGFISNMDLFEVLHKMVGNNLSNTQLQQLVDRTMLKADKDKDGKLNFEEFSDMVKDFNFNTNLTIPLEF